MLSWNMIVTILHVWFYWLDVSMVLFSCIIIQLHIYYMRDFSKGEMLLKPATRKGHIGAAYLMNVLRARVRHFMKVPPAINPPEIYRLDVTSTWGLEDVESCRNMVVGVLAQFARLTHLT